MDELYLRAGNPETEIPELRELFAKGHERVKLRLAENPNTPADILENLAVHENEEIRAAAVTNPAAPNSIIEKALLDWSVFVRFELAECPRVEVAVLKKLLDDENPYVRDQAERTLAGLELEKALAESGFVEAQGHCQRLGELLLGAGFLNKAQVKEFLSIAKECHRPFGRVLVQCRVINHQIIVDALRYQSQIRRKEMSPEDAINRLRGEHQYQSKAS